MLDFISHLTLIDCLIIALSSIILWKLIRWYVGQAITAGEVAEGVKDAAAAARQTLKNEFGYRVLASCKGDPAKIAAAIKKNPWLKNLLEGNHGA